MSRYFYQSPSFFGKTKWKGRLGEVDWRGLSDSTIDGDDSVSSLLGMATKPIRFKVKLHFFFIKHVDFDLASGSYFFFSLIVFVFFKGELEKDPVGNWES